MEITSIFKTVKRRRILPAILLMSVLFTGCALEPPDDIDKGGGSKKPSATVTEKKDGSNQKFEQLSDQKSDQNSDQKPDYNPENAVQRVVEQTGPSVVSILTDQGSGSGVIFRVDGSNGYIITNDHVIDGANQLVVQLSDKRTFEARKVGTYPINDVAVIKIEGENLQAAKFADSDEVKKGAAVIAIGDPKGIKGSVNNGIVSNVDVDIDDGTNVIRCLQVQVPINPGNSGGALINMKGEIIGINSMGRTDAENMNYAIPSNDAVKIAKQLISKGYVSRPYLGVAGKNARFNNVPVVYVEAVMEDSPASRKGVRRGDCIIKVNDVRVETVSKLREQLKKSGTDSMIWLHIARETKNGWQEGAIDNIKLEDLPKGDYPVDWS